MQLAVSVLHCHCKRFYIVFWLQMFSATDVAGAFYEISFDLLTRKLRDQMNKWFDMLFGRTKVAFQISVRSRDWFLWVRPGLCSGVYLMIARLSASWHQHPLFDAARWELWPGAAQGINLFRYAVSWRQMHSRTLWKVEMNECLLVQDLN